MSTVTTRLCQYGHDNCYRHMGQVQVVLVPERKPKTRGKDTVARVEQAFGAGLEAEAIHVELGYSRRDSLWRVMLQRNREDLARRLGWTPRVYREKPPRCAMAGCDKPARWVEDPGLDEDDEPIAEWGYLCATCQGNEDLCEDVVFLLDKEDHPHKIAGRVGYSCDEQGLESLRQRLKRWGRLDLRGALNVEATETQHAWYLQGTVRLGNGAFDRFIHEAGREIGGMLYRVR